MQSDATTSDRAALRRFGLTVGIGFGVLAAISWWRGHELPPQILGALGLLLVVPALVAPGILGPVQYWWMRGAAVLGYVNTRLILGLLYYLMITPISLVMRLFRDPLDRRLGEDRASHWIRREPEPFDPKHYERQF